MSVSPPLPAVAPRPARRPRRTATPSRGSSFRETVETLVVAVAFYLLLGFVLEGFVIPTGSMDPSLMGQHKEVECPECGTTYRLNAAWEAEAPALAVDRPDARWIAVGTCGNCRCPARVEGLPSFRGDRIAAMKAPLDWPELTREGQGVDRWDSLVFKYPMDPKVRYIKRCVGLGNEEIRISGGDLFVKPLLSSIQLDVLRKPIEARRAMMQVVHDDRHRPKSLANDPAWTRWSPTRPGTWSEPEPGHFRSDPRANLAELRYRHLVPDPGQWRAILAGRELPRPPRPSLITDFDAFNTEATLEAQRHAGQSERAWMYQHWVGDLEISFDLTIRSDDGAFSVELVEGGWSIGSPSSRMAIGSGSGRPPTS